MLEVKIKMDNSSNKKTSNKEIIGQLITFAIKQRKIMQNYLDKTGVYQAQHRLLMTIAHNPNTSQIELAKSMDVSPATIAVSLKKLEKEGYINRQKDKDDNRLNNITITEKGNRVVEQSRQIFKLSDEKVLEGFTEDEKYTLFVLLKKVNANLEIMEDEIKEEKERT